MPRARRRCADRECRNFAPCPVHPRGWAASKSEGLPSDWKSKVRAVKARSGGRCEVVREFGPLRRRCSRSMAAVDHIINRARWPKGRPGLHDLTNLQAICAPCHKIKTRTEREEGNRR